MKIPRKRDPAPTRAAPGPAPGPAPAFLLLAALAAQLAAPAALLAQQSSRARADIQLYAQAAVPVGAFADHADMGGGVGLAGLVSFSGSDRFALRVESSKAVFGNVASPSRFGYGNFGWGGGSLVTVGVGPQVFLASGAFRPYVFGSWGVAYSSSSPREEFDDDWFLDDWFDDDWFDDDWRRGGWYDDRWFDGDWFDDDRRYNDTGLSFGGGLGLLVRLRQAPWPVSLDLAASYHHGGVMHFMTDGQFAPYVDAVRDLLQRWRSVLESGGTPDFRELVGLWRNFALEPETRGVRAASMKLGVSVGLF